MPSAGSWVNVEKDRDHSAATLADSWVVDADDECPGRFLYGAADRSIKSGAYLEEKEEKWTLDLIVRFRIALS